MSQVHTWGDASLLALLLAADFTWLIADKEVNQVSLPLALVWSRVHRVGRVRGAQSQPG